MHRSRSLALASLVVAALLPREAAAAQECDPPTIARVAIVRNEVFDGDAGGLYRFGNRLHIVTREGVVRRELLFGEGDTFDPELVDQSERNLRVRPYLRSVAIVVQDEQGTQLAAAGTPELRALVCAPDTPDEVVVQVTTADAWSTSIEGRASRAGNRTVWSLGLSESNFLGRGKELELFHIADIDRTGNSIAYRDPRLAGSQVEFEISYADQSDGGRGLFRLARPIRALDTGFAWSLRSEAFDQIQPIYRQGDRAFELPHVSRRHELETSRLLAHDESTALRFDAAYRSWHDTVDGTPRDFGIFEVGLRRIEHHPELTHINHERPEDLNLGAVSRLAVGYSPAILGADDRAWFFTAEHRQGAAVGDSALLVGTGSWSARLQDGELRAGLFSARLVVLGFLGPRQLLYVSSELRDGVRLDPERQLTLGAQNGLRGYPVNQFTGDRTWQATGELRWFVTDDLLRLVSLGLTAFVDVGATWRAPFGSSTDGLRRNVGFGLLLGRKSMSTRNAAVRIDLAYALDPVLDRGRWLLSFSPSRVDF